jgi:hypothetical protein
MRIFLGSWLDPLIKRLLRTRLISWQQAEPLAQKHSGGVHDAATK